MGFLTQRQRLVFSEDVPVISFTVHTAKGEGQRGRYRLRTNQLELLAFAHHLTQSEPMVGNARSQNAVVAVRELRHISDLLGEIDRMPEVGFQPCHNHVPRLFKSHAFFTPSTR